MPYIGNLYQQIEKQRRYPAGHFYSPIPDRDEILAYVKSKKRQSMELPDVKLNQESQFKLLNEYIQFYQELPFPEQQKPEYRYYYDNGWYAYSDGIFLYCFLRKHQPKRIIEIGSGFSSALILDTVDGFFSHRPEITFIEPYPDRVIKLLISEDKEQVRIIDRKIQEVPPDNCEWSIYFFNDYVAFAFNDFIKNNMPLCTKNPGGSLYIQREKQS
jgi:hypothetical protein